MQTFIKILLADDQQQCHEAMRLVLGQIPNIEICGEAMNGEELVNMVPIVRPDLVIIDLQMPVLDGIQATRILRDLYPTLKILGLTMFCHQHLIVEMMEAGANGYIVKNADIQSIQTAILMVTNNQPYFCATTTLQLAAMLNKGLFNSYLVKKLPDDFFAPHEKNILQLICRQYSSKQIAEELGLAFKSVEKYRNNLMQKTNSQNMVGLVLFALRHGLAPVN
jgi:DNA-binding NarL/FixJ family response regulator